MHQKVLVFLHQLVLNLLIPFIYFAFLVIALKTGNWPNPNQLTPLEVVAGLLVIGGLTLWGYSYFYVSPLFHLKPQTKNLITTGPYHYLRHPIYTGALLVFFSLSYLSHSWTALGYTVIVILPINLGRALWEEKILLEVFGDQYRRYQKKTLF